jgi:hypothetical protein
MRHTVVDAFKSLVPSPYSFKLFVISHELPMFCQILKEPPETSALTISAHVKISTDLVLAPFVNFLAGSAAMTRNAQSQSHNPAA